MRFGNPPALPASMSTEPLALQIYRRFLNGDTIAQLAEEMGISAERIEIRIRAAARHCARSPEMARTIAPSMRIVAANPARE